MALDKMRGFYRLRCATDFARIEVARDSEHDLTVELGYQHARGEVALLDNLRFRTTGGKLADYLDHLAPYCYGLCSNKLQETLKQYRVTGCHTVPAQFVAGKRVHDVGALIVTARARLLYGEHMRIERRTRRYQGEFPMIKPGTPKERVLELQEKWLNTWFTIEENYHLGLYFDPHTWDGSDVFTDQLPNSMLLCTQRVVDMVVSEGITGCDFRPLEDYDWGVPNPFPDKQVHNG